jgi:hypothetical protein
LQHKQHHVIRISFVRNSCSNGAMPTAGPAKKFSILQHAIAEGDDDVAATRALLRAGICTLPNAHPVILRKLLRLLDLKEWHCACYSWLPLLFVSSISQ